MSNFAQQLQNGLATLQLNLSIPMQTQLLGFLHYLEKWNKAYNLTGIHDLSTMINYHLLDSLAIAPFIAGERILDVGSGAGFPGIPLACYYPDKHFVLLDSNGKKIRFLIQACATFNFHNIEIVHERAEHYHCSEKFTTIISRAVGSIPDIINKTKHLMAPFGTWLLPKGAECHAEIDQIEHYTATIHPLSVPGVTRARYLTVIK